MLLLGSDARGHAGAGRRVALVERRGFCLRHHAATGLGCTLDTYTLDTQKLTLAHLLSHTDPRTLDTRALDTRALDTCTRTLTHLTLAL